jgi:hypothetical protein
MINQQFSTENLDNEELEKIEIQYWVDMQEALTRLQAGNPEPDDFKKVILEGYFKDFAINQTSMLAHDYTRQTGARAEIMERLVAISNLQDYFMTIQQLGTSVPEEDEE